ncbi:NAD-binding protein, partial [Klebsiella quasipneumoniae]
MGIEGEGVERQQGGVRGEFHLRVPTMTSGQSTLYCRRTKNPPPFRTHAAGVEYPAPTLEEVLMNNQFAVIGLGLFGSALCEELQRQDAEVLAIDIDESKTRQIAT